MVAKAKELPKEFGQTFKTDKGEPAPFPQDMRRQLWPLCCGAAIISGFKDVGNLTDEELVQAIHDTIDKVLPDFQVYAGEHIRPSLTFLTLNSYQMGSKKIMDALKKTGFVKIGQAEPRGSAQGFFIQDKSKSWKAA